ncbi:fasciclin domain-containing protein [Sphingobacterium sp. LRF_L2]|uniref:fasciclin domain-containing protein n=1 Tax=Sphingobacterium sp. LRF_L2 TaxID=3369421 RepID=UPI003F5FECE9
MKRFINSLIICTSLCLGLVACSDKWADHIGSVDGQKNLYEVLQDDAQFSAFAELLEKSGYADDLKASKNYTLIVPTNSAIDAVKANYNFTDTAVLRSFVGYHIINSIYSVNETTDTVRAQNFRGKYVEFIDGAFDDVAPTLSNQVAGNGIYHVVAKPLEPLLNIYEYLTTAFNSTQQAQAVISFDTLKIVDGKEMTFFSPSWNLEARQFMTREDMKFTYFIVDDEFYASEYDKLAPYYQTSYEEGGLRPDSTTNFFTNKALLRDFIVYGEYNQNTLPAELLSVTGTTFQVDPSAIISSQKVSNGRVFRVKKVNSTLASQIKEIKVLGIEPVGYKQTDKSDYIFYRNKRDLNGELYNDLEIYGHGVTAFYAKYRAKDANVIHYKVYGRAIAGLTGDPQTTAFTQYVHFFDPSLVSVNEADLYKRPVVNYLDVNDTRMTFNVAPLNNEEVYLGEVSQDEFGSLPLLVMSNGTGAIILEYLRFVPILP